MVTELWVSEALRGKGIGFYLHQGLELIGFDKKIRTNLLSRIRESVSC